MTLRHPPRFFTFAALCGLSIFTMSCGSSAPDSAEPSGGAPSVFGDPATAPPSIGAVTPASGSGQSAVFRLLVSHPGGASQINDVQFLVAEVLPGPGQTACWVDINSGKFVSVRNEQGSAFFPASPIGSRTGVSNSRCSVPAADVKVESSGSQVAITLPVSFSPGFKGAKKIWVIASGPSKHSGWQERGSWKVE